MQDSHLMASFEVKRNLFLAVGTIISAFVTVMVNFVAAYYLLVFKKSSFNRKQYNNFLMGLQAVMGILLALTGYTWTAVAHFVGEWPAGNIGCSLATFCLLFFGTMTVMITLVMSAERFIAMCIPFYYEALINFRKIVIAVVYIVIHAVVLASLPLMLRSVELTKHPIAVCLYSLSSRSFREAVVVHAFICNFSLCILLMLVMNLSVLKALKRMNQSVSAEVRAQMAGDRESIILSNLTGLMALSYSLCWIPVLVRVMLIYHANWRSVYFDLFAFCLSTADPFVHPFTCILVSRRYRAGYKAALKELLFKLRGWICYCACQSKAKVEPLEYAGSGVGSDNFSNRGSRNQDTRGTLRNNVENTNSLAGRTSILRLGMILEAHETEQ